MALPPGSSTLLVRSVHVLGAAILLGGAVLTWGMLRSGPGDGSPSPGEALRAAATYEWLFWAGAGLLVLTGVGNIGALAPAIPGRASLWGSTFVVKLCAVAGLLVGSTVRTLAVVGAVDRGVGRLPPAALGRLRAGYAVTAVYLLLLVGLAEVLAHG